MPIKPEEVIRHVQEYESFSDQLILHSLYNKIDSELRRQGYVGGKEFRLHLGDMIERHRSIVIEKYTAAGWDEVRFETFRASGKSNSTIVIRHNMSKKRG